MLQRKRNLLSVALITAIAISAADVRAQDASASTDDDTIETTELDRVRVTGIRQSIARSIDAKQTATSIVEVVSAEDIGKLPDTSIAESIARLPGLTAQRERGRATQINIRGLAGDFATSTLNGREQASTGDNRGVEFDQYPSELLGGVMVYKTPDAALVGQGLSGTVDLQTIRPLSYDERVLTFNARYEQNKIRDEKQNGHRLSASYIDQFADGRLGLMVAVSKMDSPQPGFQNETWGYVDNAEGIAVLGGGKLYRFDNSHERTGVATTLQFKPNDFYEGTLDWFHSKFEKTEIKTGMEFGTVWGPGGQVLESSTVEGQTATTTSWSGIRPVIRMDSNPINDRLDSIGLNNKFHITRQWTLNADLSRSKVERKFRVLETYAGVATNQGRTTLDVSLDPSRAFYNYVLGSTFNDPSSLVLTDAGGWGQDGYLKDFTVDDELRSFRLNAIRSFDESFVREIDFGVNYTTRTKEKSSVEAKLCLTDCTAGIYGVTAPFPGSIQDFNFGGIGRLGVYDANTALANGTYNLVYNYDMAIAAKNWGIDEDVTTLYFKAAIDTDLGTMPLRGNVGIQHVSVDQSSEGFSTFAGNPAGTATMGATSYSHWLPSMNLGLEFMPDTVLRVALARQMARPRMDQMKASMDVGINNAQQWSAYGGNPLLHPWLANAADMSVEHYFSTDAGNRGYVGATWFHKDLRTWVQNEVVPFDFTGYPLPPPAPGQVNYPQSPIGWIDQPANGEGGTIRGWEFTASLPLDLLWAPLDGFGLIGTYSQTNSGLRQSSGSEEPITGLSKYVSNATVYYERGGFSIRYSRRSRSAFRGESRGYGGDLQTANIDGETAQDAQINYTFNQGALEGLSLYLQFNNIGDEPFQTYNTVDSENRPFQYFEYGRTTLLGFSYRF